MEIKKSRPSFSSINQKNNIIDLIPSYKGKIQRNSLKFRQINKREVLYDIEEDLKKLYRNKEKEFERKARNILEKNRGKYSNQVLNNYYKMIISNLRNEKSHRIRLQFSERILETNHEEILLKYYILKKSCIILRTITKTSSNNIKFFPNYFINENVFYIMEKLMIKKEKLIVRTKKEKNMNFYSKNKGKFDRFQEISNKIIETFTENSNNIDLTNNLKNLNDDSSSYSLKNISKSRSSTKIRKLISELNINLERNKKTNKKIYKNMVKISIKKYDSQNEEKCNLNSKTMKSFSKPIIFDQNKIVQKLYSENYTSKNVDKKNNNKLELDKNNIYFKTLSNIRNSKNFLLLDSETNKNISSRKNLYFPDIKPINIFSYKSREFEKKYSQNFLSTKLFLFNYFKRKNSQNKKKIKNVIINSIKDYESLKNKKIISILKAKEKKLIKQFVLSSSRKKLNKNFVQNDGFTTEIKSIKDILNKQKKIEEKTSHLNIKEEKDYLLSVLLYYNRNDFKYNNSISMKERIKLNIDKLMKNKNYEHIFSILEKKA